MTIPHGPEPARMPVEKLWWAEVMVVVKRCVGRREKLPFRVINRPRARLGQVA